MSTDDITAEHLADDIEHALGHSWFFDPQTISVSIKDGVVTLSGTVRNAHERRMAAAAAWVVDGVTDVVNDITVA